MLKVLYPTSSSDLIINNPILLSYFGMYLNTVINFSTLIEEELKAFI